MSEPKSQRELKIVLISAALPPQLDGIGDYTALLAAELAQTALVTVLTCREQNHAPIPGVKIVPAFLPMQPESCRALLPLIEAEAPDWVILQYQPFAYGTWGRNLHLPQAMAQIKRRLPATRTAIMVHEPFVSIENWKFAIMTTWQRWQLWQMGRNADIVFFSIESWTQRFRRWFPNTQVRQLPVGSNMPCVSITRLAARERLGIADDLVLLGLFGTAHISRLMPLVRGAAEAVRNSSRQAAVLYIGPDKKAVQQALEGTQVITEGALPAEEVSRRLASIDIFLSAFDDGISTRRGSFMAGIQHGLPVVATAGRNTDAMLRAANESAFLLSEVNDRDAFYRNTLRLVQDVELKQRIGAGAKQLYYKEFDWEPIAQSLLKSVRSFSEHYKAD